MEIQGHTTLANLLIVDSVCKNSGLRLAGCWTAGQQCQWIVFLHGQRAGILRDSKNKTHSKNQNYKTYASVSASLGKGKLLFL